MKIRILLRTDDNHKIGGVRQIYRHIDVLNANGFDAAVIHPTKGFRCSWFENSTRTIGFEELNLTEDDYLVLPELDQDVPSFPGSDKCKVVVLAQNPFGFLRGFGGIRQLFEFYQKRVSGVICVSEHSRKHLQALLPHLKVHRIKYSFDKPPFGQGNTKQKVITFMPRRRGQDMDTILFILEKTGCLAGWKIVPIIDVPESRVADIMRTASVFMAGGQMEGFGMPAAEAMACGCCVVGWHGYGAEEAFNPEFSRAVPDGDVFAYIEALREILSKDMSEINQMGQKASRFIREQYSTEKEIRSILDAWDGIMGKEEVSSMIPMKNVAAYMMANEENAYIERIIRWLSPRVGKVFVVEGERTYSGSLPRDKQVETLIGKLTSSGVTNVEHIIAKFWGYLNPATNETYMRNEALEAIQKQKFEWVWIVDSDEVYSDRDAEKLWGFFFSVVGQDRSIKGARCSWYTYWRSIHYRIDPPEPYRPNIILRSDCRFSVIRALADERNIIDVPPEVCMVRHYSWSKPPNEIKKKIEAWGHAHQVLGGWYENIFARWTPGCNIENLHPTEPPAYRKAVRCSLPIPELMEGHPYTDMELIGGDSPKRIKAIILNHNIPANADSLYEKLSPVFDDVEIWDSGSDSDKIPAHLGRAFPNIYWTGAWNEALRTCSDYDAVWMVGCDVELLNEAIDYRKAIESCLLFGCWSPCIDGRGMPFMQGTNYCHGQPMSVRNIEGISFALSGPLMQKVKKLVEGSSIGFGQDFWLCYMSRTNGFKNIIDGRVKIFHPFTTGYDADKAHRQMEEAFTKLYGKDFRQKIFEFDERYEQNLVDEKSVSARVVNPVVSTAILTPAPVEKPLTIVTVDNGWSYAEFVRITSNFPNARKIVMAKGVAELAAVQGVEIVKYDPEMNRLLAEADIALFPKVGASNRDEYIRLLCAGVPTVVHVAYHLNMIEHMKNGYYYQDEGWAVSWLKELIANEASRRSVRDNLLKNPPKEKAAGISGCSSCADKAKAKAQSPSPDKSGQMNPVVSVITPTYRRDPKVLRRSIDCMKLQTMPIWEQLVCSDGEEEASAKQVVQEANDPRVVYYNTTGKKQNDFGNTVRSEMLKTARGQFVLFLDDDNIILPFYLERMLQAIQNAGTDFAVCRIMHFGPLNESVSGKPPKVLEGRPMKLYHIDPLQVLVRREAMLEIGWDTVVGYLSDGVTLEKLGEKFKGVWMKEILGVHM
jgi:hypothetical protein